MPSSPSNYGALYPIMKTLFSFPRSLPLSLMVTRGTGRQASNLCTSSYLALGLWETCGTVCRSHDAREEALLLHESR